MPIYEGYRGPDNVNPATVQPVHLLLPLTLSSYEHPRSTSTPQFRRPSDPQSHK
jgi:hypothetical protein